jgi:hypothetical protein
LKQSQATVEGVLEKVTVVDAELSGKVEEGDDGV